MELQLFPFFSTFVSSPISSTSLPWRRGGSLSSNLSGLMACRDDRRLKRRTHLMVVMSASDSAVYKMNLNEYMVTLERPLGIRFALSLEGKIFVHSLRKGIAFFADPSHECLVECLPSCTSEMNPPKYSRYINSYYSCYTGERPSAALSGRKFEEIRRSVYLGNKRCIT